MVLYSPTCGHPNYAFSGTLELVRTRNIQIKNTVKKSEKVLVAVYKTSTNHFAVIYPLWGLDCSRKPICKINLLSTKVEKSPLNPDREFSVVSTNEGVQLWFRVSDKCKKDNYTSDDWVEALSNDSQDSGSFLKPFSSIHRNKQIQLNLSVLNEDEEND